MHDRPLRRGRQGELADGFFAVIFGICSDLDALADELGLEHHGSAHPCCYCKADEHEQDWKDLVPTARFMTTLHTASLWRARAGHKHRLLTLPGLSVLTCFPDAMHIKHQGTDTYDYASVIKLLTHHIMPASPEQNLEAFVEHLKLAYKDIGGVTFPPGHWLQLSHT